MPASLASATVPIKHRYGGAQSFAAIGMIDCPGGGANSAGGLLRVI